MAHNQNPVPHLDLSRRQFLAVGAGVAATFALPGKALAQTNSEIALADADCAQCDPSGMLVIEKRIEAYDSTGFQPANPIVSQSTSDSVHGSYQEAATTFDLRERPITLKCVGNKPLVDEVRTYNCQMPGPTFYINPGDKMSIKLCNNLSPNPETKEQCEFKNLINSPGCFSNTNMHFHGLHVSPATILHKTDKVDDQGEAVYEPVLSSDDVLAKITPGSDRQYCVWLPETHAPGTHWYHAHQHGATAIQATNGMVGTIIVQEKEENTMGVTRDNDVIWLVHEVVGKGTDIYTRGAPNKLGERGGIRGSFLVNGKCQPTLTIKPHTLQRWRFINATGTPRGLMSLQLCRCGDEPEDCNEKARCDSDSLVPMYLIAQDGISFYGNKPQPKTKWAFAPANRSDFLVSLPPGKYKVLKGPYEYPLKASMRQTPQRTSEVIAYVNVEGPAGEDVFPGAVPAIIPGKLPDYLQPIPDEEILSDGPGSLDLPRTLQFAVVAFGPGNYWFNNKIYKMGRVDHAVKLNTAERWVLCNPNGRSPHPFHIHVNPFQLEGDLIDPDGPNDPTNWRWWDTIAVDPRGQFSTRKIRQRF
ncbi:MAG: multicopper oxidase domain-containing protein [Merismopedia sp. SIO2A8]|nr:multicopper oxidase domain-containing protein [Merismopedia sp. SIO2A8]